MKEESRSQVSGALNSPGPFLAKIVSHLDPTYMGVLQVELLHESGNWDSRETQLHQVKYISPFLGNTSIDYVTETDDYNNAQKSYGMWMVPPDPGNIVVVIFINGDPKKGYWFGCIQDSGKNFQTPGYAATKFNNSGDQERVPVAEYNQLAQTPQPDITKINKPVSPLAAVLEQQGTLRDDTRGITSSSARREVPSAVFGISTPGPVDKAGKTGAIGKHEHKIPNAFVSRLGGSSFVMDDGDDKWERKTKATDGPPDYASVEDDESGLRDTPHNELIRIRTRTGHQILLHNSEDLIYISHGSGRSWIEMTANGKIDIYAKDSISVHSEVDLNFTAGRDINFTAGASVHTNAGAKILSTSGGSNETKAGGNIIETAPQIHMNGPGAATAPKTTRVPTAEPYIAHENLDPQQYTPEKTKAGGVQSIARYWKQYSTKIDTFAKVSK